MQLRGTAKSDEELMHAAHKKAILIVFLAVNSK
jgi:hypothetical protein